MASLKTRLVAALKIAAVRMRQSLIQLQNLDSDNAKAIADCIRADLFCVDNLLGEVEGNTLYCKHHLTLKTEYEVQFKNARGDYLFITAKESGDYFEWLALAKLDLGEAIASPLVELDLFRGEDRLHEITPEDFEGIDFDGRRE